MINCLIVCVGGAVGALLRYLITLTPVSPENGFPVKTFIINVAGSFLIGIVAALAAKNLLDSRAVLFLKVGICGGFTTFSSLALEAEGLFQKGNIVMAVLYAALTMAAGVAAVFLAEKCVRF